MAKILVQIVSGPEHATRAALGFLVAKTALEEGNDVTVFLAGDGVQYVNEAVGRALSALGGGPLGDTVDALNAGGARFYASKMSMGARGIDESRADRLNAQLGTPSLLLQESLSADATFTY